MNIYKIIIFICSVIIYLPVKIANWAVDKYNQKYL
jgi:hypothetical protein